MTCEIDEDSIGTVKFLIRLMECVKSKQIREVSSLIE